MAVRFNCPPLVLTEDDAASPVVPVELLGPDQGKLTWNGVQYKAERMAFNEIRELGKGRYGQVWLVQHKETQAELAVKRIQLKDSMKASLRQDLATIKKSNHENIVKFLGFNFTAADGELWIFMERAAGSLDLILQRVRSKGRFLPDSVVQHMVVSSLRGLSYLLNEHRTMHRDVKPQNILLFTTGEVKLCDFGIAKTLDPHLSLLATTQVGDPIYIPPERILGAKDYDDRNDVWALGLTAVQLALGTYPYPLCKNSMERYSLIIKGPVPVIPTYTAEEGPNTPGKYSPILANFASRCLIREYDKRPQLAALVTDELMMNIGPDVSNDAVAKWYCEFQEFEAGQQQLADGVAAVKLS